MTSPDSAQLLPCPFCGSDQVSLSEGETGDGQPWPYVECESCAATAMPDNWNNRPALARGPQQAGGEDAEDARHMYRSYVAAQERAETAEAALREAGRDAERWRFLTSMDVGEYIGLVEYNNPDELAHAIDAARFVRDGDSGEGES